VESSSVKRLTETIKESVKKEKESKKEKDKMKFLFKINSLFVAALALGYGVHLLNKRSKAQPGSTNTTTTTTNGSTTTISSYGKIAVGGPFDLINTEGVRVTSDSLKGRWVLLYFGFTMCPDVCPEQMELMGELVDIIKDKCSVDMVPVMVTIDPERDDPAMLKDYLEDFHPDFIGLTGTEGELDPVCLSYRVYRSKGQAEDPRDYIMDHTITQYVLNPRGDVVGFFLTNRLIDERVEIMQRLMSEYDVEFGTVEKAAIG